MSTPRTMPCDLAAEKSVLAAVLHDNASIAVALEVLHEEDFYQSAHRAIWTTLRSMMSAGQAIDAITLVSALTERGTLSDSGGAAAIQSLAGLVVSPNIREHAMIVSDCAMRRRLIRSCSAVTEAAYVREQSSTTLTEQAQAAVLELVQRDGQSAELSTREKVEDMVAWLRSPESGAAISTGIPALDKRLCGGFREEELVIIAARTGKGKSSLAMQIAQHVAIREKRHVGVISLEMSDRELLLRAGCSEGRVPLEAARARQLDKAQWERLLGASRVIANSTLTIYSRVQSIESIIAWAQAQAVQKKLDLLVIDYLQFANSAEKQESRVAELAVITRALKFLAKRLKIPVVVLSQLSRASVGDGQVPELHHLRESGSIEQDADIVLMIHHPDPDEETIRPIGYCEIWVKKNRNGEPDVCVPLIFKGAYVRFDSMPGPQASAGNQPSQRPAVPGTSRPGAASGPAAGFAQPSSKPAIPRTPIVAPPKTASLFQSTEPKSTAPVM